MLKKTIFHLIKKEQKYIFYINYVMSIERGTEIKSCWK